MGRDLNLERSIFSKFQKAYHEFPSGEVVHADKPDFIIEGSRRIGVEITRMFQDHFNQSGSMLKLVEEYQRKVLMSLTELLRQNKMPHCVVSIDLGDSRFPSKIHPHEVARSCAADIVRRTKSEVSTDFPINVENYGQLPIVVKSWELIFHSGLSDYYPMETANAIGKEINNDNLQYILNKKELAKKKFTTCDIYWLVINVGSFASDYYPEISVKMDQIATSFDKVFVLKYLESEIIELK